MSPTEATHRSRSGEFWAGVVAEGPILIGVIPLGVAFGVLAIAAKLGTPGAIGLSNIVFAGSSQFVAAQMLAAGAPWVLIVLTIFVVNLRHALYSASIAAHVRGLGRGWKIVLAYLLTDEAYAVAAVYFERVPRAPHRHWFLLGAGVTLWAGWQAGTILGALAGAAIPAAWNLDFMLPLVFIGLVVPIIRDRTTLAAAGVAATVAVCAAALPYKLNILLAIGSGLTAGMWVRRRGT